MWTTLLLLPALGLSTSAASLRLNGRAAAAATTWSYAGCYQDSTGSRLLPRNSYADGSNMTRESCISYCAANGNSYAGTEYGSECWCGLSISGGVAAPDTDCSMACSGNSSEVCGNGNRLSVYSNGNADPVTNPGPAGWSSMGCYSDSGDSRTLAISQGVSAGASGMTVAQCTAACKAGGYPYAGVEYADECYCDSAVRSPGAPSSSGCNMPCAGNSSEYCGGSNRINVYHSTAAASGSGSGSGLPAGWSAVGCYTDNGNARTLGTQQEVPGGYTNMTVEGCLGVCTNLGYTFGGVEYSQECYCGNAILNNGTCAADQSTCSMPCKGNTTETCGGPNRLNVFYSGASPSSVGTCSAATSSSSTSTTTTTTMTSSVSSVTVSTTLPASSSSSTSATSTTLSTATSSSSSAAVTSSSAAATSTSVSSTTSTSTTTSASPTSTVCPTFWTNIAADLAAAMRSNGVCTDFARASIRYAFHDASTFSTKLPFYSPAAGGADGSLLLSATEINRTDNDGLHDYHDALTGKLAAYRQAGYAPGAADLIQFAGAMGVLACPGGRIGRVLVGRGDTATAAPQNLLPAAFGAGSDHDTIYQLFADKGFAARDLAALLGAHSTSIANFQAANGIPAGTPQDTTPTAWDVQYYNDTLNGPSGVGRFASDINLSKNASSAVGKQFKSFVGAQAAWGASFSSAFQFMSLLGVPSSVKAGMQDCTTVVANAFPS